MKRKEIIMIRKIMWKWNNNEERRNESNVKIWIIKVKIMKIIMKIMYNICNVSWY
jgi:hypothetical protein